MKIIKEGRQLVVIIESLEDLETKNHLDSKFINFVFVPNKLKENFLLSDFRVYLLPCLYKNSILKGKVCFYE